jgi:hypothetical protein
MHEQAAMLEESYVVDNGGNVPATPRFLPLAINIRLVVSIVQRYRTNYEVDYSHRGWSNLKAAIEIRKARSGSTGLQSGPGTSTDGRCAPSFLGRWASLPRR